MIEFPSKWTTDAKLLHQRVHFSIAEKKWCWLCLAWIGAKSKRKKVCVPKKKRWSPHSAVKTHRDWREKSEIHFSLKYLVLILRKMVDLNSPLLGYKEHGATREKGFRNGKSYLLMPCAHTSLSLCVQHFTFTQQKPAMCLHGLAHIEWKWRRKSLSHDILSNSLFLSHAHVLWLCLRFGKQLKVVHLISFHINHSD